MVAHHCARLAEALRQFTGASTLTTFNFFRQRPAQTGLVLAASLLFSAGLAQAQTGTMSDAERAAFRSEVRAFLLEEPEVLIEAYSVLEERRMQQAAASDLDTLRNFADEIYRDPASWSGGNPDGDITIVEFLDYRCGYCRRAYEEVEVLLKKDGNLRFVVKELPILGEQSVLASRFAVATLQLAGSDAYEKLHHALMAHQGDMTTEALTQMLETLEIAEREAIVSHLLSDDVTSVLAANHALAENLGINGTPGFVIGDGLARGYIPLDAMEQMIAEARAKLD